MKLSPLTDSFSPHRLAPRRANVSVYRWPMKKIIGRLNDWRHERHISLLSLQCREAMSAGDKDRARLLWNAQAAAIKARSNDQVARMERRTFLRMAPHDQRMFLKNGGSPGAR